MICICGKMRRAARHFALDEKPYHDQIVEFYQEEEKNRAYLPGYEEYHARQLQRLTHLEVFSWTGTEKGVGADQ